MSNDEDLDAVQIERMNDTGPIDLRLTAAAKRELGKTNKVLHVELELLFSCFLRKRVLIVEHAPDHAKPLKCEDNRLRLWFTPVMTRGCLVSEGGREPGKDHFPLVRSTAFQPRWVSLDFRKGQWRGEFGYSP